MTLEPRITKLEIGATKGALDAYDDVTKKIAIKIIKELKVNSNTYKEVFEKLSLLEKTEMYYSENREKFGYLFSLIRDLLNKEMNDLPLTNRS